MLSCLIYARRSNFNCSYFHLIFLTYMFKLRACFYFSGNFHRRGERITFNDKICSNGFNNAICWRIYLSRAENLFQLISSPAASSCPDSKLEEYSGTPFHASSSRKVSVVPAIQAARGDSEEVPTKSKSFSFSLPLSSFRQVKKEVWNERRIYTEGEERIEEGIRGAPCNPAATSN